MVTEEKLKVKVPHSVILDERQKMTLTGVADVDSFGAAVGIDSFDEQTIIVRTALGELTVRGEGLHISRLNTETGELNITGKISAMAYTDDRVKGGLLSRMFR